MARITQNLFEAIQNVTTGNPVEESQVDKAHFCATHVEHALLGYGECISEQHAEPDEEGNIAWYTVKFPVGTHKVESNQLRVVEGKSHTHSKKMAEDTEEAESIEEAEGGIPKTDKHKKLAAHYGDPNRITRGDVITAAKKKAMQEGSADAFAELEKEIEKNKPKASPSVSSTAQPATMDQKLDDFRERAKSMKSTKLSDLPQAGQMQWKKDMKIGEEAKKDMSAFDWKSKVKKPESNFAAKKISTGTVYTKKYKEEKDDDDLKSASRRAKVSSVVKGMKESITQTVINHNDFVLEVTDNPTFKDYFAAMQAIVPSMDENIQKEMVAIATEAYNEGYQDVILESMARQAFSDVLNNYRKEGYNILDENYKVESGQPFVEYTVEKNGEITQYVHTGAVIKD